jgi:hypothetical protein
MVAGLTLTSRAKRLMFSVPQSRRINAETFFQSIVFTFLFAAFRGRLLFIPFKIYSGSLMDDLTLVLSELDKLEYKDIPAVSRASGIPEGTIAKLKCRQTKNPRYGTVAPLAGYFRRVLAAEACA